MKPSRDSVQRNQATDMCATTDTIVDPHRAPDALFGPVDNWLSQAKRNVAQSDCVEVIVDLTMVEKVNSEDLSELIRLQLQVKHAGRRLVLANVQETIFQVFTLTRLDRLIELRHDGQFDPPSPHFRKSR